MITLAVTLALVCTYNTFVCFFFKMQLVRFFFLSHHFDLTFILGLTWYTIIIAVPGRTPEFVISSVAAGDVSIWANPPHRAFLCGL